MLIPFQTEKFWGFFLAQNLYRSEFTGGVEFSQPKQHIMVGVK